MSAANILTGRFVTLSVINLSKLNIILIKGQDYLKGIEINSMSYIGKSLPCKYSCICLAAENDYSSLIYLAKFENKELTALLSETKRS